MEEGLNEVSRNQPGTFDDIFEDSENPDLPTKEDTYLQQNLFCPLCLVSERVMAVRKCSSFHNFVTNVFNGLDIIRKYFGCSFEYQPYAEVIFSTRKEHVIRMTFWIMVVIGQSQSKLGLASAYSRC